MAKRLDLGMIEGLSQRQLRFAQLATLQKAIAGSMLQTAAIKLKQETKTFFPVSLPQAQNAEHFEFAKNMFNRR